jgi:hypothetical protein
MAWSKHGVILKLDVFSNQSLISLPFFSPGTLFSAFYVAYGDIF